MGLNALARRLGGGLRVRRGRHRNVTWTYLDSFDWRLHARGEVLVEEADEAEGASRLDWRKLQTGDSLGLLEGARAPRFAGELAEGPFRQRLEGVLEMRALLPQARLRCRLRPLELLDPEGKVVARLRTQSAALLRDGGEPEPLGEWLVATPVRGYDAAYRELRRVLEEQLRCAPEGEADDLLRLALAAQGRRPGGYSSKLDFHLDPRQPAAVAVAEILRAITDTLQANVEGTIADLDSEFLHDLRVAVRRTRSALKQLAAAMPAEEVARFREGFARLGAVTGPARDMDVYLLQLPTYRAGLPGAMQADLDPLQALLAAHKASAHAALVRELRGEWFAGFLARWRDFLDRLADPTRHATDAGARPILELANRRIWKVYRRVHREGRESGSATPGPVLHELRKRCKELRYLMEFFRSLYPGRSVARLIKALKSLQETLGIYQDLEVHIASLRRMSHELAEEQKVSPEALLAMGALIERLERDQERVRGAFRERFAEYASDANRRLAAELFRAPRPASDGAR